MGREGNIGTIDLLELENYTENYAENYTENYTENYVIFFWKIYFVMTFLTKYNVEIGFFVWKNV